MVSAIGSMTAKAEPRRGDFPPGISMTFMPHSLSRSDSLSTGVCRCHIWARKRARLVSGPDGRATMKTEIAEIADGIYRLSTHVAEVAPPAGFTFNQFLVMADQPLLFHCGMRGLFPLVSAAVA